MRVSKNTKRRISKITTQGSDQRFHFLPPCGDKGGPWFADFREIVSAENSRADELRENRFASIAAPFVPNLVHRFAAYIGRIGQPEIDVESLAEYLSEIHQSKTSD